MKQLLIITLALFAINAFAQTLPSYTIYDYQTVVIDIPENYSPDISSLTNTITSKSNNYGNQGYELASINQVSYNQTTYVGMQATIVHKNSWVLTYKRAKSLKEAELAQVIQTVHAQIDSVSKHEIAKAKGDINTDVLNYLSKIPASVLSSEYAVALQKQIMATVSQNYDIVLQKLDERLKLIEADKH